MIDVLLIGTIVVGAFYLLYRSLWKKGCYCPGCDVLECSSRKDRSPAGKGPDREITN